MSEQKTLNIKRVFAWSIFSNLRVVPPKDFPTTAEIRSTLNMVLPALKEQVTTYSDISSKAGDVFVKVNSKELNEEDGKKAVETVNEEWRKYNQEHGNDMVGVVLDDEGLKTLKEQFNREGWGKKWVATLEEFGELLNAFEEASK